MASMPGSTRRRRVPSASQRFNNMGADRSSADQPSVFGGGLQGLLDALRGGGPAFGFGGPPPPFGSFFADPSSGMMRSNLSARPDMLPEQATQNARSGQGWGGTPFGGTPFAASGSLYPNRPPQQRV